MRCEIVAVGTELLLGQIVDTNSAWIGEQLALAGIDCHRHTSVGDNRDRMLAAMGEALERSDAVIVTGGLGPTQDDITRDVIAELLGVGLVRDESLVARIEAVFGGRGRPMPANNLRQADVPVGARTIDQMPGTAPGLVCPVGTPSSPDADGDGDDSPKVMYAVPGVPWEMHQMVEGTILPDLKRRAGISSVIRSRTLRTWGRSESGLAEDLADEIDRIDRDGGATIAFLASGMEGLKVRLTAKAATDAEVDALLADGEARVRAIAGPIVFGVDDQTMESVVLDLLVAQGLRLATAESLTGGMIGTRLTEVPGSSRAFMGSIVAYDGEVKRSLLGVSEGPVVSEEAVRAMALGACERLGADVSVAVTGVAGPDPQEGQEPGTVWMATCVDGEVQAVRTRWPFDRTRIRQFTVITVLDALRIRLLARRNA
ncbi:MAG: competence/damage-inducible protein A [Acidimicrobiaceae bacterium]|nr:competence/damage-inducible protein A [Acidimicrobiaceae bacterium]